MKRKFIISLSLVSFLAAVLMFIRGAEAQPIPSSTSGIRSISVTAPITSSGGRSPIIGSTAATAAVAGHVTTDAQTFAGTKTYNDPIVSAVASGSYGLTLNTGARIRLDGTSGTKYIYYDSGGTKVVVNGAHLEVGGNCVVGGGGTFGVTQGAFQDTSTTTPLKLKSYRSSSATSVAMRLAAAVDFTHAGSKIVSIGDNEDVSYTEHANYDKDGAPTWNVQGGGSKPTCDSTIRGKVWRVEGGGGVADTLEICRKDAANNYAWAALF